MKEYFSHRQISAIERGALRRERLVNLVATIISLHPDEKYNSLYVYSPPGLGKTFTVSEFLQLSNITHFSITGNTSLFAFGIQLAVINYLNPDNEQVIIHVDDCDEIFKNEANCNAMKKILDTDKVFVYEKSLSSQWNSLSEVQKSAIEAHSDPTKMGFVVPVHTMKFIFTSNFQLPTDDEVANARKKSKSRAILMSHRNAIRSRCKVADFDLSFEEHWGWLGDVVLNTSCLDTRELSVQEKVSILDFLYYNWTKLTERSIRLIEKMAITLKQDPRNYKTIWEFDYIKP